MYALHTVFNQFKNIVTVLKDLLSNRRGTNKAANNIYLPSHENIHLPHRETVFSFLKVPIYQMRVKRA